MIRSVSVSVEGTSPLVVRRYLFDEKAMRNYDDPGMVEKLVFRDGDTGELYLPGMKVLLALCRAVKPASRLIGRRILERRVRESTGVSPERIGLGTSEYSVYRYRLPLDPRITRPVPRIDSWRASFSVEYDDRVLSEEELGKLVDVCGSEVGLSDVVVAYERGVLGTFRVVEWRGSGERS